MAAVLIDAALLLAVAAATVYLGVIYYRDDDN